METTVKNFIDLYHDSPETAKELYSFYQEKVTPELILEAFNHWVMYDEDDYKYVHIMNIHPKGWETEVSIHDNFEYSMGANPVMYFPKKMHEFISDCLRNEEIHLEFNPSYFRKRKIDNLQDVL